MLIVMEYMINGSLLRYMRNGEGKNFNFKDIINIAAQIADGMKYLVYRHFFLIYCKF
jgi:serine/threonine protein kinase